LGQSSTTGDASLVEPLGIQTYPESNHISPMHIALRSLAVTAGSRSFATVTSNASSAYTDPSKSHEPAVATTPDITRQQRDILDAALRVDQAGEVAANWIYRGQMTVLERDPTVGPLIQVC
jgi:3-demethoxyubiquinol 3-hydroxylase